MAVHTQQTQWFIVRPEMVRKLGVGLGVFTSAIGLYYAAAHLGPQDAETMPIDKNRVMVDMRKREDKPTRLQAPIDASPAFKVALALKPEIPRPSSPR
ncbi:hypothetical protein LP421_04485 (plasmid) [Rhizobium sp. RCAM05350]|nr:hypothetical protein LP421_04485 [Rhizobium sp. RCAM05350]